MTVLDSIVSTGIIRTFAWTLLHSLWQGALIALIAATVLFILRRNRPVIKYVILYGLIILIPVLFAGTFIMTYNPDKAPDLSKAESLSVNFQNVNDTPFTMNVVNDQARITPWYQKAVHFFETQAKWLVLIWFAGFIFFLLRFTGSVFFVYRLKNYQVFPVEEKWRDTLRILSGRIGLSKSVKLAESAIARVPMTIGYLKPVILLPIGTLSGVPPQQLEAVLLHELAHILRRDYLLNIIQSVIEMLFFYHPVTWWLSGLIREEREHICDDLAVSINHDHINYIKALTTMEELNSKSPLLASAMTGSKKRLLNRMKRLLSPIKPGSGLAEGITAFVLLVGLVLTLSVNALSFIPSTFDLSGRETGEKLFNLLPFAASKPDSVVATSKSGKVTMKVYTDTVDADDQKNIEVIVEEFDNNIGEWDRARDEYNKEVIVIKRNAGEPDNMSKVMIIKSGDSIQIVKNDTMFWLPANYDTTIVTEGGFGVYGFSENDFPEIPELPEIPEMKEMEFYYFNDDNMKWTEDHEKAMQEYEFEMQDLERKHQMIRKGQGDARVIVAPPGAPKNFQWTEMSTMPPMPPVKNAEKIIRQELKDDGLTIRGKNYVIELDAKSMYINGEKQPKETYRKYRKLVESLESMTLDGGEIFKLIF